MDTLFVILSALLILTGILGCFLPLLPGPPLAWAGLFLLHFTSAQHFSTSFLVYTALATLVISLLDYIIPAWMVKRTERGRFGGRGVIGGSILGLILGGPIGMIAGAVLGAFLVEWVANGFDFAKAKQAAWLSFKGFLISSGIQFCWCLILLFWYLRAVF